jgi:hypothetical protein
MQPPFLLTQSRNLHNDTMWKKKLEVIPPYKIVVVRTYILIFYTHWPPRALSHSFFDIIILILKWPCVEHARPPLISQPMREFQKQWSWSMLKALIITLFPSLSHKIDNLRTFTSTQWSSCLINIVEVTNLQFSTIVISFKPVPLTFARK